MIVAVAMMYEIKRVVDLLLLGNNFYFNNNNINYYGIIK
jgi:hypothetical protein